jgi:hypothetical protein
MQELKISKSFLVQNYHVLQTSPLFLRPTVWTTESWHWTSLAFFQTLVAYILTSPPFRGQARLSGPSLGFWTRLGL